MLKFRYNYGFGELNIKTEFSEENVAILSSLIKDIEGLMKTQNNESFGTAENKFNDIDVKKELDSNFPKIDDKPYIRERLPNGDDEKNVRVGDYKAVGEKVTAHYNFMCPKCHQAMSIKIAQNIIIKDIESENKLLHMLNSSFPAKSNKDILEFSPQELGMYVEDSEVVIMASEEIYGSCINCGHHGTTKEWVETYLNKELILESDKHCEVCGTEMLYNVSNSNKIEYTCDNSKCGYKVEELN